MSENKAVLVYVTVPNLESATRIGRQIIERRLAGCANVIPKIHSIYRWDGKIQEDEETLLLFKAGNDQTDALMEAVAQLHPYEVPAISVIPLDKVHEPYLAWLLE